MTTRHLQVLMVQLVLQEGRALLVIARVGRCGVHTAARRVDDMSALWRRLVPLMDHLILIHKLPMCHILAFGHFGRHMARCTQAGHIV